MVCPRNFFIFSNGSLSKTGGHQSLSSPLPFFTTSCQRPCLWTSLTGSPRPSRVDTNGSSHYRWTTATRRDTLVMGCRRSPSLSICAYEFFDCCSILYRDVMDANDWGKCCGDDCGLGGGTRANEDGDCWGLTDGDCLGVQRRQRHDMLLLLMINRRRWRWLAKRLAKRLAKQARPPRVWNSSWQPWWDCWLVIHWRNSGWDSTS